MALSPAVLLAMNLAAWGAAFFRAIVIDDKATIGAYPLIVSIPGVFLLCFLGPYLIGNPTGKGDRIVGYLAAYGLLGIAVLGVFGF
jgi:hypothetical protein